jgi:glycosyltransferase involved in cell wall biosynthesis
VPPLREYVTPGRDAVLVPAGDHEALAAALLALADAPEHRARIAAAGVALVREHYRLEALTKRLVKTYRGLVGHPQAPHPGAP